MSEKDQQKQFAEPGKKKRYVDPLEVVASVVLGWVMLCGCALLFGMQIPRTEREWVVFFISAPPLFLGFHVFGEGLFYSPDKDDQLFGEPWSLRRIVVRMVCLLGLVATILITIVVYNWATGS